MAINVKLDFNKLVMKNGNTVPQQLKIEAARFKDYLEMEIAAFYGGYTPTMYGRTMGLQNAVGSPALSGFTVRVKSTGSEYHEQMFGGGQVNTMLLMSAGYATRPGWWGAEIDHFGYRPADDFLQRAVDAWNANNYFQVSISKPQLPL